jgi:tRNA U34 5-carboxymethylaminomethyl modifying GTPase MnmE/TrmE
MFVHEYRSVLETNLRAEQECRQRLHDALNNEKEKLATLQFDVHELNLVKQVTRTASRTHELMNVFSCFCVGVRCLSQEYDK